MEKTAQDDGLGAFFGVRPRLFGIAYRMLGSTAEAEDLVQDVWMRWQSTDRRAVQDAPDSVLRYEKTLNLLRDLNKQRPEIISIVSEGDTEIAQYSSHTITVPNAPEYISPLSEFVALQLLAYFMATERHIDIDNPRNLVKAVVQE